MHSTGLRAALLSLPMMLGLALPALADNIDATDPAVLTNLVKGFGSGTLDKGSDGDPMIRARINGIGYVLFFFGCKDGAACKSVTFYATWETDTVKPEQVAAWNVDKRFVKAYLDKSNQPCITMDVNLQGGVSQANFEDNIDWWQTLMAAFKTEVLDKAG